MYFKRNGRGYQERERGSKRKGEDTKGHGREYHLNFCVDILFYLSANK